MWVTTKVTYDGHPEHRKISLKRMAKGLLRALLYLWLVLMVVVAVYQVFAGGIIDPMPEIHPNIEPWEKIK